MMLQLLEMFPERYDGSKFGVNAVLTKVVLSKLSSDW